MIPGQRRSRFRFVGVGAVVGLCLLSSCALEKSTSYMKPVSREAACSQPCPYSQCPLEQEVCERLCDTDEDVDGCWSFSRSPEGYDRGGVAENCTKPGSTFALMCFNEYLHPSCTHHAFR